MEIKEGGISDLILMLIFSDLSRNAGQLSPVLLCCELSGTKLSHGLGHDGRGGGAVCGHCVVDPAVSVPGLEVSDDGGGRRRC